MFVAIYMQLMCMYMDMEILNNAFHCIFYCHIVMCNDKVILRHVSVLTTFDSLHQKLNIVPETNNGK